MRMAFRIGDVATDLARAASPCWRKQRLESRGAAEAQMRSLLKRGLEKDAATIRAYACPHCGFWHVGHRKEGQ